MNQNLWLNCHAMRALRCIFAFAFLVPTAAIYADVIATRNELNSILSGSEEYLEDFEEVSLHSGSTQSLPNPFNIITGIPYGWGGMLPGVSYSSTNHLQMYAGFLYGDDSNILQGRLNLTITFDEPQVAIGFDLDGYANGSYHQIIKFYHNNVVIGMMDFDLPPGTTRFIGWQDAGLGITSVRIDTTASGFDAFTEVDNVAWGLVAQPAINVPPTTLNVVRGFVGSGDVTNVADSDDSYLRVNPGFTSNANEPPVWLEFEGMLPTGQPTSLEFSLETHANTVGLAETVELFNYESSSYEVLHVGSATTSDWTTTVTVDTNFLRFVQASTSAVKVRLGWKSVGPIALFPWTISTDRVVWSITTGN